MSEFSRKQQEYYDSIKKAIESGDHDMLQNLFRNKDSLAIRHDLSTALGQHVNDNYDDALNIFQNKAKLEEVPINYTDKLPDRVAGRFVDKQGAEYIKGKEGIFLPVNSSDSLSRQTGTRIHELAHANDRINNFRESNPFPKTKEALSATGLEKAEEIIGDHHKVGFLEKEALKDLLQNKKIQSLAAIGGPLAKAAGLGALGLSVAGVANKAMAGEPVEAAKDAADIGSYFIPYVGEMRMAKDIGEGLYNAPKYLYDKITEKPSVYEKELAESESETGDLPVSIVKERERFNKLKNKIQP